MLKNVVYGGGTKRPLYHLCSCGILYANTIYIFSSSNTFIIPVFHPRQINQLLRQPVIPSQTGG